MKIADLKVGSKVLFGSYSVSGEEPHRIPWIKVHPDCTLLTEFIEDQCAFDAREVNNERRARRYHGSNRYSTSNINQFLNSNKANWFTMQTPTDAPPIDANLYGDGGEYYDKPGFLHRFKPWELDAILHSKLSSLLHPDDMEDEEYDDEENYEGILVRAFLPSRANITGRGMREGSIWEYFVKSYGSDRRAHLSSQCFKFGRCEIKPDNGDDWWSYGLRTMHSEENSAVIRVVDNYGDPASEMADSADLGIRPALVINSEVPVSDVPNADGYYEVLKPATDGIEIQEDEFVTLIKT